MSAAKPRFSAGGLLGHGFLLATSAFMLTPFVWMLSLSLKSSREAIKGGFSLLPEQFQAVENYAKAFTAVPLLRFMANGAFVAGTVLILQIAIAAPCAYALAKLDFRGSKLLFGLVLVSLMIPQEVLGLPLFILFHFLGLLDSYPALILPFAVSPFAIFLLRQAFKSIPDDLVHAARLDGLSEMAIVWRIMVPSVLPSIAAFSILSVISRWNNLFWPSVVIRDPLLMPPPMGLLFFRDDDYGNDYGPLMAVATVIVAPLLLTFLASQRQFYNSVRSLEK